jgi:hypothetical protein
VVVTDALVWDGAGENRPDFAQFLLRALIYRAVADRLARLDDPPRPDDADPFLPAVEVALRTAADSRASVTARLVASSEAIAPHPADVPGAN